MHLFYFRLMSRFLARKFFEKESIQSVKKIRLRQKNRYVKKDEILFLDTSFSDFELKKFKKRKMHRFMVQRNTSDGHHSCQKCKLYPTFNLFNLPKSVAFSTFNRFWVAKHSKSTHPQSFC